MQTVSTEWKSNHNKTLVGEGFVEVSLDIADPDALADASSQDNGATYISNTPQVVSEVDKVVTPYSTLEQNIWVLDGSRKTIPVTDLGNNGFVGDVLSDEKCVFSSKMPQITVSFTRVHTNIIPAITIVWGKAYGEYAEEFVVTAYNGNDVVAQKEVLGNRSVESIVMMDIVDYDRITIAVVKWCLPRHRARIEEIFVGMRKIYSKSGLFSYNHTQTVDPVSTSLPKTEILFSVDNSDDSYNPYNDSGLSKYLMERQEVRSRYGYKVDENRVEWIKGGTFYLYEWKSPQNGMVADFTARDLLEFMFVEYKDNVTTITSRSLYNIAEEILTSLALPLNNDGSRKWYLDESLKNVYTSAPLPIDSVANCLLLIANAGCCTLYQDRDGTLRIEPLRGETSDYTISQFNSYSRPEISLSKPIKEIVIKVHQYSIADGEIKDETTEITVPMGVSGERIDVDNPLITDNSRATTVGLWVGNYLKNRIALDTEWRPDVRLDALDIVKVDNDYGASNVRMTDVSYTFNGAFRGSGKGRVV